LRHYKPGCKNFRIIERDLDYVANDLDLVARCICSVVLPVIEKSLDLINKDSNNK
jgi:hypothetical protein